MSIISRRHGSRFYRRGAIILSKQRPSSSCPNLQAVPPVVVTEVFHASEGGLIINDCEDLGKRGCNDSGLTSDYLSSSIILSSQFQLLARVAEVSILLCALLAF